MNFKETKNVLVRLAQDTFRQSFASGVGWLLLGLSTICIAVCLSVSVSGPKTMVASDGMASFLPRFDKQASDTKRLQSSGVSVADGSLRLAFGAIRVPIARDIRSAVHFLQLILAAGVADTLGLLLTLIWTAGFLPGFLAPQAAAVLLAKPVPRWGLLIGKYIGVLLFVLAHAAYFVGGTWLALALRTGVWDTSYLLCIPLLLVHFAIFFSVSLLLAVCFRSTVVCVFGSIGFWLLCWAVNFGRHAVVAADEVAAGGSFSPAVVRAANISYWLLPKPVDLGQVVYHALGAEVFFRPTIEHGPAISLSLSVATSLAFTVYILFAASQQFAQTDY